MFKLPGLRSRHSSPGWLSWACVQHTGSEPCSSGRSGDVPGAVSRDEEAGAVLGGPDKEATWAFWVTCPNLGAASPVPSLREGRAGRGWEQAHLQGLRQTTTGHWLERQERVVPWAWRLQSGTEEGGARRPLRPLGNYLVTPHPLPRAGLPALASARRGSLLLQTSSPFSCKDTGTFSDLLLLM